MATHPLGFDDLRPDPRERQARLKRQRRPLALLLDRVRDPRNAGALFRLADAALLDRVYGFRTGDLPGLRKVRRVARATHRYVPFQPLETLSEVEALRSAYTLIGLETTRESIPYSEYQLAGPALLMVGNEVKGLDPALIALAEACVHVPMHGMNTSMNLAMAAAIAVYGMLEGRG